MIQLTQKDLRKRRKRKKIKKKIDLNLNQDHPKKKLQKILKLIKIKRYRLD